MRLGGYLLALLAVVLAVVVVFLHFQIGNGAWSGCEAGALGVAGMIAFSLFAYSRRLRASGGLSALREGGRPPILLLRAFKDDYRTIDQTLNWSGLGTRDISFEEVLFGLFSGHGPVVAIGRPGETVPPFGAARLWISGDHWKAAVEEMLAESRFVVMVMGDLRQNPGLAWEVDRVLSPAVLDRVILVMPPVTEEEAHRRWEQFRERSGKRLPDYQGGKIVATFRRDGTCEVARVARNWRGAYRRDRGVYREAFRGGN